MVAPAQRSASSTALWIEALAFSRSTMAPLRVPRDSAEPCPRYRRVPSTVSPTNTQVLALPASMMVNRFPLPAMLPQFLLCCRFGGDAIGARAPVCIHDDLPVES